MATTPTKSRSEELLNLGRRSCTAVDSAAPSVDEGYDVTGWDQVLLVCSGDAVGLAEVVVYAQLRFIATTEAPTMIQMAYLRAVPLKDHTSTYRGNAVFVLNTMKVDRVFPALISFSGATTVYLNVYGITRRGEPLLSGAGIQGEDDADVFDVVDIVKVGGQTLAAHGAASTTIPVPAGARATAAAPTAVDANDVVLLSADLYSRLRTLPEGATADDAADTAALNPVKVGGIAASHLAPDLAQAGDMVHLSTDLYRRVRVLAEGPVADDAAVDATNPVKVGAVAVDPASPGSAVTAQDLIHATSDLYRRLRVLAEGPVADDAADVATNPVKVGGRAYTTTTLAASDVAAGDAAHFALDLEHRLFTFPMGGTADDAASDALAYPIKVGAVADQVLAAVADGDMAHLVVDLYRRLQTRGAAYDETAGVDRGAVNTIADDRDEAYQVIASQVDDTTDPDYFPSSSGYEVGNRTWLTFQLGIRDGVVTFESSNDGTSWTDVTKMVVDRGLGYGGFASWSEPDAATVYYQLELVVGARYVRVKWDPANATSIIYCYLIARVNS